jgi:hypothetical protein
MGSCGSADDSSQFEKIGGKVVPLFLQAFHVDDDLWLLVATDIVSP